MYGYYEYYIINFYIPKYNIDVATHFIFNNKYIIND